METDTKTHPGTSCQNKGWKKVPESRVFDLNPNDENSKDRLKSPMLERQMGPRSDDTYCETGQEIIQTCFIFTKMCWERDRLQGRTVKMVTFLFFKHFSNIRTLWKQNPSTYLG